MKKKFSFKISKEAIVNLTDGQLKSIAGGAITGGRNTSCEPNCVDQMPVVTYPGCGGDNDVPYTQQSQCPTQSCYPGTSFAAGCGTNPSTLEGCNTSESNCISTKLGCG